MIRLLSRVVIMWKLKILNIKLLQFCSSTRFKIYSVNGHLKLSFSEKTVSKVFRQKLIECLEKTPDKICQIAYDDGTQMSYAKLATLSIRLAVNLQKLDNNEGDII